MLQGKVFLLRQLIRKLCVWSELECGDVVLASELGHFAHRLFIPFGVECVQVCTSVWWDTFGGFVCAISGYPVPLWLCLEYYSTLH